MKPLTNWAGNITFRAARVHHPASVAEVQALVAGHRRVGVLGTGHSFNTGADTTGQLLRLDRLPPLTEVDTVRRTVRVSAGTTFAELGPRLHAHNSALPNLGSLPHISVAGACATATHGSGNANPVIAAGVRSLDLVTAGGDLITLDRTSADFAGAVVSLGALGVVTALTLDLVPAFDVQQYVYTDVPWQTLADGYEGIAASAYSVSVFTDWREHSHIWVKHRMGTEAPDLSWTGGVLADEPVHPVAGHCPANCTPQLALPGPGHLRLPHFRAEFVPSTGDELQSEYFVRREHTGRALEALRTLRHTMAPVLHVSEIRTVAADECWLSPAWQRHATALHFTWARDPGAVAPVIARIEEALAPLDARPHWGKVFSTPPRTLAATYGRMADFCALRTRLDPLGKFANEFTDRHLPNA
ncbi:D-arabinono-1,4-lactone oxidase [Streptomyces sp. NRRL F-2747]|uniref:D-arabinono-1,4-lactone oxidase n=1 Tax=Streptomyces sp. NRRL F-2747 TaxID=1463843 RepID=UPI0004C64512|nr:D-arabinono-1,4-lactone oxidase [Streptomyces sp. NRRL F-2747]